jgi:hypothetical protein
LPVVQSVSIAQVVLQAPVPQMYGAQLCCVGVEQVPLPEQNAALVSVEPVHDALPHWTDPEACWQAPATQRPVLPQVPLVAQPPCGSDCPFPTAAQLPVPEALQDWQVGQAPTLQQTPSTQWLLPHSWSAPQVFPSPFLPAQLPPAPVQ